MVFSLDCRWIDWPFLAVSLNWSFRWLSFTRISLFALVKRKEALRGTLKRITEEISKVITKSTPSAQTKSKAIKKKQVGSDFHTSKKNENSRSPQKNKFHVFCSYVSVFIHYSKFHVIVFRCLVRRKCVASSRNALESSAQTAEPLNPLLMRIPSPFNWLWQIGKRDLLANTQASAGSITFNKIGGYFCILYVCSWCVFSFAFLSQMRKENTSFKNRCSILWIRCWWNPFLHRSSFFGSFPALYPLYLLFLLFVWKKTEFV